MDSTPPEQPKPQESATQEEKVVPKNIIRPFAQGLLENFSQPIQRVREELSLVPTDPNPAFQEEINQINPKLDIIINFLQRLKTAKTVKIKSRIEKRGKKDFATKSLFELSEETEPEETPRLTRQLSMSKSLTKRFAAALGDTIANPLAEIFGDVELIKTRSNSEDVKKHMETIHGFFLPINNYLTDILKAAQIKIALDAQGKITIKAIPPPQKKPT